MIVIPENSPLYQQVHDLATGQRMVFFAGLPGVGKSLFLQQMALMAHAAGRRIHLLQWDVTRAAFESAENLARYPEVDGVTHAAIRKGVGLWAREGVQQWHARHPNAENLLIGEVPLIGNRLIELAQKLPDIAEFLLASKEVRFVIPTPSRQVREVIEAARAASFAQPQHEKERADAAPTMLQAIWQELYALAQQLRLIVPDPDKDAAPTYDPMIYAGVYEYLLQHRHLQVLPIDTVLPKVSSVYELDIPIHELQATPEQVATIMAHMTANYTAETLAAAVDNWYRL